MTSIDYWFLQWSAVFRHIKPGWSWYNISRHVPSSAQMNVWDLRSSYCDAWVLLKMLMPLAQRQRANRLCRIQVAYKSYVH